MHKFLPLIEEQENSTYESELVSIFQNANKGSLNKDGVFKLVQQIKDNKLNYAGFPEWVLKSWIDASKIGAIPLNDNRWLNVQTMVNSSNDIDPNDIVYSGFVVDANKKSESGIKAISLSRSHEVNIKKFKKLVLFKLAANEAQRIIQKTDNIKSNLDKIQNDKQSQQTVPQQNQPEQPNF